MEISYNGNILYFVTPHVNKYTLTRILLNGNILDFVTPHVNKYTCVSVNIEFQPQRKKYHKRIILINNNMKLKYMPIIKKFKIKQKTTNKSISKSTRL